MGHVPEPELNADAFYDAGDEGCAGPTLKEIGALLDALAAGEALEVRTRDPVGRTNLEAWSRLKGYEVAGTAGGAEGDRWLIRKAD
jgi:TusA-related sulfurtransferase